MTNGPPAMQLQVAVLRFGLRGNVPSRTMLFPPVGRERAMPFEGGGEGGGEGEGDDADADDADAEQQVSVETEHSDPTGKDYGAGTVGEAGLDVETEHSDATGKDYTSGDVGSPDGG